MFNRDLIRGSLVSLCLSSGFPSAQQTWLSLLFDKLGTCIMQKWGFLAPYTNAQFTNFHFFYNLLLFIALRVRNKVVSSLSLLQLLLWCFGFINQKKFTFTYILTYLYQCLYISLLNPRIIPGADAVKCWLQISLKLHLQNCSNFVWGLSLLWYY